MRIAILRPLERDDAVSHNGSPEVCGEHTGRLLRVGLLRIRIAVEHQAEVQLADVVIRAASLSEHTRLHITHTFAGAKEDAPAASLLDRPLGHLEVLVLIAVLLELRIVRVPLEVRPNLITDFAQIGVIAQIVSAFCPLTRDHPMRFRLDRIHDAALVQNPHERGFPIAAAQAAAECLIGGDLVTELFPADPHDRVREKCHVTVQLKLHDIVMERLDRFAEDQLLFSRFFYAPDNTRPPS